MDNSIIYRIRTNAYDCLIAVNHSDETARYLTETDACPLPMPSDYPDAADWDTSDWAPMDYDDAIDMIDSDEIIDSVDLTIWYAVMRDMDDDDWSNGSFSRSESIDRAIEYRKDGCPDAYIAMIQDDCCIGEIHDIDDD